MGYGSNLTGANSKKADLPRLIEDKKIKDFLSKQRSKDGFLGWLRQLVKEKHKEELEAYEATLAEFARQDLARKAILEVKQGAEETKDFYTAEAMRRYNDEGLRNPDFYRTFDLEKQLIQDKRYEDWFRNERGSVGGDRPIYTYSPFEVENDLIKQYEAQDAEAYRALRRKQLREESKRKWKESRKGGYSGPFDGYVSYKDLLKI